MKNYNIITLGPSGAGKTVFLASLFKQLSTTQEGAFLKTFDDQQRIKLNQIYAKIIDPDQNWPSGTRDITQITFTCYVKNLDLNPQNFPVCQFTYIDYSGGLMTDRLLDEEEVFDFQENVSNADAVLAIIDGLKLLKLMQGENLNNETIRKFLLTDLPNMMQLINQCQTDTPVNFIISKWDLLEGRYNLLEIEKCLREVDEFNNVVNFRVSAGCPVRIIPVSSIGMDFATLQPDGSMKKNPDAIPKPLYLEIPIAYLLIDDQNSQRITLWNRVINSIFKAGVHKVGDREKAHNHLVISFNRHIKDFEEKFPDANLGAKTISSLLIYLIHLTQAISLILLCFLVFERWAILCLPFGIVAIVYATQAKAPLKLGYKLGTKQASKNAKKWFLFGFIPAAIIAMIIRFS